MSIPDPPRTDRAARAVRWVGIALAVVDTVAVLFFGAPDSPALYGLAASMMLGSLVLDARKGP